MCTQPKGPMSKSKALETARKKKLLSSHEHLKKCIFQPPLSVAARLGRTLGVDSSHFREHWVRVLRIPDEMRNQLNNSPSRRLLWKWQELPIGFLTQLWAVLFLEVVDEQNLGGEQCRIDWVWVWRETDCTDSAFSGPRPPWVRCTSMKKVILFREFPL